MTAQDQATPPEVADVGEFTAAWQAWHADQEARLADPHGSWPSPACTGSLRRRSGSTTPQVPGTPARTA